MFQKFKKYLLISLPTLLISLPVFAQVNLPAGVPNGTPITIAEILGYVTRAMTILTSLGIVIGVIFIILGGIEYMRSGSDPKKAADARAKVINGFIGVAIVLGVGVIIQTAAAIVNRSALNF